LFRNGLPLLRLTCFAPPPNLLDMSADPYAHDYSDREQPDVLCLFDVDGTLTVPRQVGTLSSPVVVTSWPDVLLSCCRVGDQG
jgi:hypothetical protein